MTRDVEAVANTAAVEMPDRLAFVANQVWGAVCETGDATVVVGRDVPSGWRLAEQYWAIPSARDVKLLIPTERLAARRMLTGYARLRSPRTRLVRRALGLAALIGVPLSRDVVSVGVRSSTPSVVASLGAILNAPTLTASIGARLGANAKPTLELRSSDGAAVGFAKLGWNELTTEAVANEAAMLLKFEKRSVGAIHAPGVLASGTVAGREFLITEPLPASIADVPAVWTSLRGQEVFGPGAVVDRRPLSESRQVQAVRAQLASAGNLTPEALIHAASSLADALAAVEEPLPMADIWHGDFVPWNVGRDADGLLWVFDWETAEHDVPAGLDTLHWFANTAGETAQATLVEQVSAGAARAGADLRALGHSRRTVRVVAGWYTVTLVVRAITLAERLGSWQRVNLTPEVLIGLLEWARGVNTDTGSEGDAQ